MCAPTNGEGDCNSDDRGSWDIQAHEILSAEQCAARCRMCARCAVVSFSAAPLHRDCSWYAACDLGDLRRPPPTGRDYLSIRVRPNIVAPPPGAHVDAAAAGDAGGRRHGDKERPATRIALATLAVGARMRCGLVRWCQGARRLRASLDPAWHVDLLLLRDGAATSRGRQRRMADEDDCPGMIEIRATEVEGAARECVRSLDADGLVPLKSSPKSHRVRARAPPPTPRILLPSCSRPVHLYSHDFTCTHIIARGLSSGLPTQPRVVNLLKWSLWSLESRYDLIFYSDVDVDPLPASLHSVPRVGALWKAGVPALLSAPRPGVTMLATADSMSPVHGGLFLLRPSVAAYSAGLSTLRRCRWNQTHGWDHIGAPRSLDFTPRHLDGSPAVRDVGSVNHPTRSDAFKWNDWSFWGASVDQGLFWYEHFLRGGSSGGGVTRGAYSRWSTAHKVTHEWGGDGKPWEMMNGKPPQRRPRGRSSASAMDLADDMDAAIRISTVSKLAVQLRYLGSIDLSLSNGSLGSPCARQLWRMRRSIEADPRFEAIWHRLADAQNPTFSVW